MKQFLFLFILLLSAATYAQQKDSVIIRGRVTDFNGQPIDSASIWWKTPRFSNIIEAVTDKNGDYMICIPKGKYQSIASIYLPSYAQIAMKNNLPEADHRLEFWAWNFIADRDTILNIRYHRMEAYGLHVFRIPGATPAYQIYVRPIGLTRTYQWMKGMNPESSVHSEISGIEQPEQGQKAKGCRMAPPSGQLKAIVWIDGEEVPILMKQEIKEYFAANQYGNTYLLTVALPKHPKTNLPYRIFRIELTDLENGDQGEGLYYMEKENYIK
ncbi:carboxypeptidase-like regulatory domain-containing protein [Bacteroides heparinolyticus]|uniref:carboxypeptidase-like regulatory domain-containing protein n=1 Tax=Prevotella heparinolytica TaxID=28113 RepID=UPI0035A11058